MLAWLKKRVLEEFAFCPTMEATQLSPSLQDPNQSPLEVPEESIHKEQPLGNPRTESLDMEKILPQLRGLPVKQDSPISEITELRALIKKMNQRLKEAEFRLSSLEARDSEIQQNNLILSALQSDPRAVPATSSSESFTSHQMSLDVAQTATSPSSSSVYISREPGPPSASGKYRTASRTLVYPESEDKTHQMLPDLWSQETTSEIETAHIEADESINEDYTFSKASPLITPEYKKDPQNLVSTEETEPPVLTPVWFLDRISESDTAWTEAEESVDQMDIFSTTSPLITPEYTKELQTMTSTEETDPPLLTPICSLEISESDIVHIEAEESVDQEDIFYKASPLIIPQYEKEPQTLTSTEETDLPMLTPVWSLERISESKAVYREVNQDIFSRALPSIAPEYETDPHLGTHTEELALPMIAAVGFQERIAGRKTTHTEPEEPDRQENDFSGGSPVACEPEQQPLMGTRLETPQLTAPAAMGKETPGRATHLYRSPSSNKRSSSTALTSNTISAETFSQPASLPPADVRPPIKRQKKTITCWRFTKKSKFITTCNICKMDVTTEKIVGSDTAGTAALVAHLEREHQFSQVNVALAATGSKIEDVERPSTTKRPGRTASAASICTTTSPATLSCLPSPSAADMKPPSKHRKTSFVWKYFTKKTKFIAICNICNMTVRTGKIGGCSNVGTAAPISHLKRIHNITQ